MSQINGPFLQMSSLNSPARDAPPHAASENLLGFFVDGWGTKWVARVALVVASRSGVQAAASAQDASSVATKLQRRSSAF